MENHYIWAKFYKSTHSQGHKQNCTHQSKSTNPPCFAISLFTLPAKSTASSFSCAQKERNEHDMLPPLCTWITCSPLQESRSSVNRRKHDPFPIVLLNFWILTTQDDLSAVKPHWVISGWTLFYTLFHLSLPWCHLKMTSKNTKAETLSPFWFVFCTGIWKGCHKNV